MSIKSSLEAIKSTLPPSIKLVAVSKFHGNDSIMEAYNAGQRLFGESRVQELNRKQVALPEDIEWHLIGHLQTNKIKTIVPYIHTIQSIDSWKLLVEIDKFASKVNRIINCLLEIYIAEENSKYGLSFEDCKNLLEKEDWRSLKNIQIAGVMGMATNTEDESIIRKEFKNLKNYFEELKSSYFEKDSNFREISMGMSHDYKIAIEEGSTIVRVGTSIFGEREY